MSSNMNCDDSGIQNCSVGVVESTDQTSIDGNDTNDEVKTSDLSYTTRLSTDESALDGFELVSINSSDEKLRNKPPPLDISHRQGSGSSTKTCEADCEEEKDTFSPVSNSSSPSELAQVGEEEHHKCNGNGDNDNKLFEKQTKHAAPTSATSTSKEEKQRQNEEIVIMETSSISSETGSWESIFPNQGKISAADVRKCCNDFLQNEKTNYFGGLGKATNVTACFIDASSLRDEEEGPLSFSSLDTAVIANNIGSHQLESFHKTFKFCKGNRPTTSLQDKLEDNLKHSNSSDESFEKPKDSDQASNLSDEEKLSRKRDSTNSESLGGVGAGSSSHLFESSEIENGEEQDCLSSSSDSNEAINLRKVKERNQSQFAFQHNIQELSRVAISPKAPFHNDTNYTTDYSSSSPVASLVWSSETEKNPKPSCVLPDTPHNSIVQIHSRIEYRDSGAYCSDATDSPIPLPRTPKRFSKFDEANPIVSGGASIQDFSTKQCESPVVRRKTESCPIVSGGFMSLDFERVNQDEDEFKVKPKTRNTQGVSSWIVDMSDCKNPRDTNASSNADNTLKNGVGYFVSLANSTEYERKQKEERKVTIDQNIKKPTGFYVDLSGDDDSCNATPPPSLSGQTPSNRESNDKKNIFSMFIDFGEKKIASKKEPLSLATRLSNSFYMKKGNNDDLMKSSTSSTETLMSKSSQHQSADCDLKYIEQNRIDAPEPVPTSVAAIRRISKKLTASNDPKRHSWTNNPSATSASSDCKRSMSLTGDKGLMHIIDKIPLISKACSLSVDSSLSPFDDFTSSKSEIGSTYSNNSTTSGSGGDGAEQGNPISTTIRVKKRRKDVQLNETFDKSSLASITDGVFSKDISPTSTGTDTEDLTFQQDDEVTEHGLLANASQVVEVPVRPLVMETIIEAKETFSPKKSASNCSSTHTMESLNATIEKQKQLLETVSENAASEAHSFVKLSDMDKPIVTKFELHSPSDAMSRSVGNHRQINRLFHETSRARPHSWTMTRSSGPSILNITSSVDNLRSLSRLFPQFSKEFSSSLPNDFAGNAELLDYANSSDFSINSSLASSFSRSGMDESSISYRQPRRLGEDLLKMFLQEIATDMTVEVNGRRIKAHKCILRSRCQYFAAMLAGGWAQSSGNVVSLQGYSYSAVHFALCHIYSGASHPPDGISLMELAALADLLGLEGLKEVTAHALKNNYCHNFHKPCSGCIDGILQVLPVALNHALDDLYRKCLKWTCRHYLKVWPTRSFAQLPTDILFRCRQQIVAYLTSETVLGTVLDCDNLLAQLAPFRWASVIENLVRDILDVAYGYIADHFSSLIASDSFLSLGHDKSSHIPRLESLLLRTASSLTSDQACRSYQRITRLNTVLSAKVLKMPHLGELAKELQGIHEEELEWNEDFIRLIGAILSAVEQCLTRQCSRAMRVNAWQRMDLELRKKIQTLARLTEPLDLRRGKAVAKAFSFGGSSNRSQDLYQVKLAIQAHSKRVLANDSQLYKATAHTQTHVQDQNIQTTERGVQASHEISDFMGRVLKTNSRAHVPLSAKLHAHQSEKSSHRRTQSEASVVRTSNQQVKNKPEPVERPTVARLSDVRPRYLEPRKPKGVANIVGPVRSQTSSSMPSSVAKGKHISSSDSSRNSSPAIRKNVTSKEGKIGTKSVNMSLDSLASPSRKNKSKNKSDPYSDVCADSLGESMKSSMITNKTISQESLTGGKLSRSNPVIGNKLSTRQTKHQPMPKAISNRPLAKGRQISSQATTSAGSSPSSITNKSGSRLSSVSSVNSPRDVFKNRSISVPGNSSTQPTPTVARKSFLSAKSREILARRAEKNKQMQHQKQTGCANDKNNSSALPSSKPQSLLRATSGRETAPVSNRNSLPSNIPTRRPNSLHLKKTNTVEQKNQNNQYKDQAEAKAKFKNALNGIDTIELNIENSSPKGGNLIEARLERSSTFCKESSDLLDVKELQAIE